MFDSSEEESLPPVHGADLDAACARYGGELGDWIDFSSSVNPFGFAESDLQAMMNASTASLPRYPDPSYTSFREALARHHGLESTRVFPLAGSIQGIHAAAHMMANRPAIIPAPSFREYAYACRMNACPVIEPLGFEISPPDRGIIIIGYPNSPTGELIDREKLLGLIRSSAERNTLVVVDEAFLPFVEGGTELTLIPETKRFKNLLVLRSLTKTHAFAGVRLGFAVGNDALIARLHQFLPAWSVSQVAIALGIAACDRSDLIDAQIAEIRSEAPRFEANLRTIPRFEVRPSAANFFLCRSPLDAVELKHLLSLRRILIRNCSDYPGLDKHHVRISVRKPEENEILVARLREILS